jgi:hypothetical protein
MKGEVVDSLRTRPPRLGYANVVATLALVLALGGTAYAAATIGSSEVIDNSLRSVDLRDGKYGVRSVDVRDRSLGIVDLSPAAVSALGLKTWVRNHDAAVSLPAGSSTTVTTLSSLPKGSYLVLAKTNAVNFSTLDYIRCRISVGGSQVDATTVTPYTSTPVASMTMVGAITTTSTANVVLACSHDSATVGIYVEASRLFATRVRTLDVASG